MSGLPAAAWTLTASPGVATHTGSATFATFTGLTAGTTYTFTVTLTSTGCVSASSGNVVVNAQPAVLAVSNTKADVSCFANGSINITASGGTAPYTYDWTDIPGTNNVEDRSGLAAGSYSVIVTDANNCTVNSGAIVVAPSGDCTGIDVCKSDAAKVFWVTPDPENTSYTWTVPTGAVIVSGQDSPSITVNWNAVAVGTYTVKVHSNNTCGESTETLLTVYINAPPATATVIGGACLGADLQLSAGGGQSYSLT